MKTTTYLLLVIVAATLALVGCGKSSSGPAQGAGSVDIKKLQDAFPSATPMVQNSLDKFKFLINQGRWDPALNELSVMARFPNLSAEQKQAINDVTEQVKKLAAAAPVTPAQ